MQFLEHALYAVNFPYTALMGLVLIYWLTVMFGLLDLKSIELDMDADADLDHDVSTEVGHPDSGFSMGKLLYFFNIGQMPFMIVLSFLALFLWIGSILGNYYLENQSWGVAALLFVPLLVASLFLTKYVTMPFVKVFEALNASGDTSVVGKVCTIILPTSDTRTGQAEIETAGLHQTINVRANEGMMFSKGEQALVVEYQEDKHWYIVDRA